MSLPAVHNKAVWSLVLMYIFTMITFGFLHSVLSVIFVVEGVISTEGVEKPIRTIPLSIDIPPDRDPCTYHHEGLCAPKITFSLYERYAERYTDISLHPS